MKKLRRKLAGMLAKKLPYDARVEFLESTGTQYIDTMVYGRYDTPVTLDTEIVNILTTRGIFGSFSSVGTNRSLFLYTTSSSMLQVGAGGNLSTDDYLTADTNRHLWKWEGSKVFKDGNLIQDFGVSYTHTLKTLSVFTTKRFDGTIYPISSCRVYGVTIFNVMELIPVRVGTVGYMYDTVSGSLFGNAGTGDFIVGPDI